MEMPMRRAQGLRQTSRRYSQRTDVIAEVGPVFTFKTELGIGLQPAPSRVNGVAVPFARESANGLVQSALHGLLPDSPLQLVTR